MECTGTFSKTKFERNDKDWYRFFRLQVQRYVYISGEYISLVFLMMVVKIGKIKSKSYRYHNELCIIDVIPYTRK